MSTLILSIIVLVVLALGALSFPDPGTARELESIVRGRGLSERSPDPRQPTSRQIEPHGPGVTSRVVVGTAFV